MAGAVPGGGPGTAKANLNLSKEGWYTETSTLWPGQGLSLQVEEILFQDRSDFQASLWTCLLCSAAVLFAR